MKMSLHYSWSSDLHISMGWWVFSIIFPTWLQLLMCLILIKLPLHVKKVESDSRHWNVSIEYHSLWNNKHKDDLVEVSNRMLVPKRGQDMQERRILNLGTFLTTVATPLPEKNMPKNWEMHENTKRPDRVYILLFMHPRKGFAFPWIQGGNS